MNFMIRWTFDDEIDEDIYRYQLMLKVGEILNDNRDVSLNFNKLIDTKIRVQGYKYDSAHAGLRLIIDDNHEQPTSYDICQIGNTDYLHLINVRTDLGWGRNFIKDDERSNEYSFFDSGNEEEDAYLDSKCSGGVIRITEEEYFQQSLVREDIKLKFEDLPRYMEALKIECDGLEGMCFFSDLCPVSTEIYNEVYQHIIKYYNLKSDN